MCKGGFLDNNIVIIKNHIKSIIPVMITYSDNFQCIWLNQ